MGASTRKHPAIPVIVEELIGGRNYSNLSIMCNIQATGVLTPLAQNTRVYTTPSFTN
jgi:hypothetical protein